MCIRVAAVAPRRIHLLMKMNEIFARHGSPDKVGSDNGSQFNHAEFAKTLRFVHCKVTCSVVDGQACDIHPSSVARLLGGWCGRLTIEIAG